MLLIRTLLMKINAAWSGFQRNIIGLADITGESTVNTCHILLVKKRTKAKIFCSLIVSRRNDGSLNFTEELQKYVVINNWDRLHRPFFSAIDLGRKGQNAKDWAAIR
jgi:hypothetical protein